MNRGKTTQRLMWGAIGAVLLLGVTSWALAEICLSPYVKQRTGQEKYLYVWSIDADAKDNDFLAVIDVNIASPTYGTILTTIDVGSKGNEPHHMGFTDDRTRIWAGTLFSNRIFIFDIASDPSENMNVIDKHPDVVERLKTLADKMRDDLGDSATKKEGKGVRSPGRAE